MPPPPAPGVNAAAQQRNELTSDATFLTFEPGLYKIGFRAHGSGPEGGMPLPCARLDALVLPGRPGRATVSMVPEGGWLSQQTSMAHVLVVGGKASAVLTVYRPVAGMPMPEVYFTTLLPGTAPVARQPAAAPAPQFRICAHIQAIGDQLKPNGEWAGDGGGEHPIEGFQIDVPDDVLAAEIEYQAVMGEDWRTPWFNAGTFCGSRGLELPLLGFRVRLTGQAAEQYACTAWGRFATGAVVGPVRASEEVEADRMPLTGMRVEFTRKQSNESGAAA